MSSKSVLKGLVAGEEDSNRIIILDSVRCNGRSMLKNMIHYRKDRYEKIHLLATEVGVAAWTKGLPQSILSKMTIHDLVSGHHSSATDLPELVPPGKESNESRHLVVVDSLSFLLLRYSMEIVCRWLINHTPSLLLVHSDLHEDEILAQLQYIATSLELCWISQDCVAMDTAPPVADATCSAAPPGDPTANLTFDLRLSTQEKEARSKVVLPYTTQQQAQLQDEDEDDYDDDELDFDSDPDDDLDI